MSGMLDFHLYLGPDDLWHAADVTQRGPCASESECEWMPWCRIDKRCRRVALAPSSGHAEGASK